MKEFELIAYIKRQFKEQQSATGLLLPIGDDCSIIAPQRGMDMVTTADSMVDGSHFSLKHFTPVEIGRKTICTNISDMASMGAKPPYYGWLTFAIPPQLPDATIKGVINGIKRECKKYGVSIAGGNITAAEQFSIHLTLSGWIKRGYQLSRSSAGVGDSIFVTGKVGAATLAYKQFKAGKKIEPFLLRAWASPIPRPDIGIFLSENRIASSCLDISDGIFQDLSHILKASSCGAELWWGKLPIDKRLRDRKVTPQEVGFGEDYQLLFTVPKRKLKKLSSIKSKITEVGVITSAKNRKQPLRLLGADGKSIDFSGSGWSHM